MRALANPTTQKRSKTDRPAGGGGGWA